MDEPPRDNNMLGLLTVVIFLILGVEASERKSIRSYKKQVKTQSHCVSRIICFLRSIHSPLCASRMLI